MALTKDDLKQIRTVVKEETYDIVKVEIGGAEKRLGKKIENEIGTLASMTKREFDRVGERFDKLEKGHQDIRKDISHLEFVSTETVTKPEHYHLKERVRNIELKLKMSN